MGELMNTEI